MSIARKYTIMGAELTVELFTGEVIQVDEVGTTHVHGHGGGGVVSNGEGYVSDVRIGSHTSWETKVWVNHEGKEVQWCLPGSLAFRPGHKIAFCRVSDGKKAVTCFVKNITTDEFWEINFAEMKQLKPFEKRLGRLSGWGCLSLIFLIVAVWHFFVHEPDHVYLYLLVIPMFVYVYSKFYKSLDAKIKNNIRSMIDSIMKDLR